MKLLFRLPGFWIQLSSKSYQYLHTQEACIESTLRKKKRISGTKRERRLRSTRAKLDNAPEQNVSAISSGFSTSSPFTYSGSRGMYDTSLLFHHQTVALLIAPDLIGFRLIELTANSSVITTPSTCGEGRMRSRKTTWPCYVHSYRRYFRSLPNSSKLSISWIVCSFGANANGNKKKTSSPSWEKKLRWKSVCNFKRVEYENK